MSTLYVPPKKTASYQMPTRVFYGRGLLKKIDQAISLVRPKKIIVVAGEHFKSSLDYILLVQKLNKSFEVTTFETAIKVSNFSTIDYLSNFCRENGFDTILSIGGGTILDVAKSAAILAKNDGSVKDFLQKKKLILRKGIKVMAIPTTAGTGSEVTPWATIWGEDGKKYSLISKYMFPMIALVDPATTDSLSPKVTAESGIDALCQSIEAYWNINHNSISDLYALQSIKLIISNLKKAVIYGNKKYRNHMMLGSLLGGLSFSNTQTTICHAISYPITINWNVHHGQATSITLPLFIKQIFPLLPKARLARILKALDSRTTFDAASKIESLMRSIGLETKLSKLGVSKNNVMLIAKQSMNQNRLLNSPIIPTVSELANLLLTIF